MPHSLRAKIKGLRYKGIITDKDCDRLCKALDNEDLLDKIRTEIKEKYGGYDICEDAISRQVVDDAIYDYSRSCDVNYQQIMEFIEKIPSVTPQQKNGHWIFDEILDRHYYCSECKSMGVDYWNYCPYCGARMESEE